MLTMGSLLTLHRGHWYTWQMMPGYTDTAFYSPIFLTRVQPLKTGKSLITLDFYAAAYAEGVQNFSIQLRVLKRTQAYLLGEYAHNHERTAIISRMSDNWLEHHFPEWCREHGFPSAGAEAFLNRQFAYATQGK